MESSTTNTAVITHEVLEKAMSYQEYKSMIEQLLSEGKTTGPNQTEDYVHYTKLNFQRMKRLDKTSEINQELKSLLEAITYEQIWFVISEPWCGDAAQNVPVIQKMADLNSKIEVKIILRDENLEIMDNYLTNGGRAIPKLIALDKSTLQEKFIWGPRPASIQEVMNELKANNVTDLHQMVEKIQIAYNNDHTASVQSEFISILKK
jgi:hypothetical protein